MAEERMKTKQNIIRTRRESKSETATLPYDMSENNNNSNLTGGEREDLLRYDKNR